MDEVYPEAILEDVVFDYCVWMLRFCILFSCYCSCVGTNVTTVALGPLTPARTTVRNNARAN